MNARPCSIVEHEPGWTDLSLYDKMRPMLWVSSGYALELSPEITVTAFPRLTIDRGSFIKHARPYSIALDGFVRSTPFFLNRDQGPVANFDHHEGVNRLATSSTAHQVNLAIKQGLFSTFSHNGAPRVNLCINDVDQDVCLAVSLFLLAGRNLNPDEAARLDVLVNACDRLDRSGALCAFDPAWPKNLGANMAWIFEPYDIARSSGSLRSMDGAGYEAVLRGVHQNLLKYVAGNAQERPFNTQYEKIGEGKNFWVICESGPYAKHGAFSDGALGLIVARENPDDTFTYTIARASEMVDFDVPGLFRWLNKVEGILPQASDRWGGGRLIGGSPRLAGSKIDPKQMLQLATDFTCRTIGEMAR